MVGRSSGEGEISPEDWRSQFKHPECPLVLSLQAAGFVIRAASDQEEIGGPLADERLRIIHLKSMAVAAAQEVFGCPRDSLLGDELELAQRSYACSIPAHHVDTLAFGSTAETAGNLLSNQTNRVGF